MDHTICAACGITNMGMQTRCLACGTDLVPPSAPTTARTSAGSAAGNGTAAVRSDPPSIWQQTHRAPPTGLAAYHAPDPTAAAVTTLEPGLGVERVGEVHGWARVICANGWSGWVDANALLP